MYLTCMGLYVGLVQHYKKSENTHTHAEGGRDGQRKGGRRKRMKTKEPERVK